MAKPTMTTLKRLFARSGNRCAFPGCSVSLVKDDIIVGEVCHINAANPDGPRYDSGQSEEERRGVGNLILLCCNHHKEIDDDYDTYTVGYLKEMKRKHEAAMNRMPADVASKVAMSLLSVNQSGGIAANSVHVDTINVHLPPTHAQEKKLSSQNALQIILGSGGHYECRENSGRYMTHHVFSVGIKNVDRGNFLSNCKVYLNIANETGTERKDYLLDGPFTLNPTEERYIAIVSYREPATVSKHAGDFIQMHVPVGFAYGAGYGWPWRLPVGAYTFSLWAISKETSRSSLACKIWVVDGKLHFEAA